MTRPFAAALLALLFAACATNPARRITANDVEVVINDDSKKPADAFTRGDEKLDEQEFYESIGDTQSLEAVKSSRATGSMLQKVGVALATLGFAAGGAGLGLYMLSGTGEPPPLTIAEDVRQYTFYAALGGAALAAAGIALTLAMGPRVRGDNFVFDLAYARNRLEVGRYGEGGATPDVIHSLSFGEGNQGQALCASGSMPLGALVAKDEKGRTVKVSDRADWFNWKTTPVDGLLEASPDAPVLRSPIGPGLAAVDADVGVNISVAKTGIGHDMTFAQSFACGAETSFSGEAGDPGQDGSSGGRGKSGSSREAPSMGNQGKDGKDGKPGERGAKIVVELSWVTTPKRGRLALLVAGDQVTLFDPAHSKAKVIAAGGRGGRGGSGGDGGTGGDGHISDCQDGASGGTGGRGGRGGQGGTGGSIEIRATDRALLEAIEGSAPGGEGGRGGAAGAAGSGGSGSSCKKGWAKNGGRGSRGSEGGDGVSGEDGSVVEHLVAAEELTHIARVLAANPQLTPETGTASASAQPIPRRKRR